MKKFLCTLLVMVLMLTSLCVPAFAYNYKLGDKVIGYALSTEDPVLGELDPILCWSDAQLVRGELLCKKDHEHTDSCYDLVKQWVVCARHLYVDNQIELKFDKEVSDVVVWIGYGNGSSLDLLTPSCRVGSEFDVFMNGKSRFISCDSNDKSSYRIKRITINYIIDNVYYTDGPYTWDDLYSMYKSNGGRLSFRIKTKSEGGVEIGGGNKIRTSDDSSTTTTAEDAIVSALANLIEERSAENAETEITTNTLTRYCTAYDLTGYDYQSSTGDEVVSATFCPICGLVSDGAELNAIEHATVSGDEQEGELKLHMGELISGETVMTACFTKNGEIVQPTGTVTITVPMDYPHSVSLATKAGDGTETELPYTIDDNGCMVFTLNYDENSNRVSIIHVDVLTSTDDDAAAKAIA